MKRSLIFLTVIFSAFAGAVIGIVFMLGFFDVENASYNSIDEYQQNQLVRSPRNDSTAKKIVAVNFKEAAQRVIPAVVHIRTVYDAGEFSINPLEYKFNVPSRSSVLA
ncbi:MAG: hypothetical protein HC811_05720 [Flammeovirgaceae bacterium]|nr:hypothetical protein [Flammeovirgaceae bacterium]